MSLEGRLRWARKWRARKFIPEDPLQKAYLDELAKYEQTNPEKAQALAAAQSEEEAEKNVPREAVAEMQGTDKSTSSPVSEASPRKRGRPRKEKS